MLRILCFVIMTGFSAPLGAATLGYDGVAIDRPASALLYPFEDALDAYWHSYRDTPGRGPLPVARMSVQLPLVGALAWWIATVLPSAARRAPGASQAARAAPARSRIR